MTDATAHNILQIADALETSNGVECGLNAGQIAETSYLLFWKGADHTANHLISQDEANYNVFNHKLDAIIKGKEDWVMRKTGEYIAEAIDQEQAARAA